MKHAMELYNKALDDLQSKNEDIAIIALKRPFHFIQIFMKQ